MLKKLPRKSDYIFNPNTRVYQSYFLQVRKSLAHRLSNLRLKEIHFHTIRHWKATTLYHQTKDILHVMEMLGHRDIKTTLIYTQLISFEKGDYHVKVSKSLEEDRELLEAGFEYVTDRGGIKIYRKRK